MKKDKEEIRYKAMISDCMIDLCTCLLAAKGIFYYAYSN